MASPSRFRKRDRLKFWKRWRRDDSNNDLTASVDQEQDEGQVITEPPSLSVGGPQSPALSETATTPVESAMLSEPCITNNTIFENDKMPAGSPSLWDLAYEALREEKPEVVQAYEELLSKILPIMTSASSAMDLDNILSDVSSHSAATAVLATETSTVVVHSLTGRREMMANIITLGQKHMDGKRIAFNIGREKFVLRDQMEIVVAGIQAGKDWIGEAVKASPLASAAWAGASLLLPLLTNPIEVQVANEQGLAYVAQKIRYYTAMESLLLGGQDERVFTTAMKREYEELFIKLYQAIIDFQAQSVLRFFRRRFRGLLRDAVKWDSWEDMLKIMKESGDDLERASLQINSALSTAALGELTKAARETYEDKCLQSLSGNYAWYKGRIEDRVPDTCRWFLNHTSYQSWLEADSGPLLVSADPGCGKSVLAKYLIDSNFGFRVPREAAICYFFFKEGDQNTITQALCALIHQLLCLRPELRHYAMKRYKQDGEKLSGNVTALWDILETAAADPKAGTIIIVLDALDECSQDERNMATLSQYIQTHFEDGPKNLKILMTSRPYQSTIQHIQKLEQSFPNIRINGEDESETIREEINSVIEFRVSRMDKFDDGLRAHLKQRLLNITHRTYLWLYLIFSYLESTVIKNTAQGLNRVIETLPTTVEDAYEKILNRSPAPEETRKAMLVLLAASRPLTLAEMQVALDVSIETRSLTDLDLEPDGKFKHRLRELCGLFVTVHDERVYFLHQTAREFLLPLSTPPPRARTITTVWAHTFSVRQAHTFLAESCVAYLGLLDSQTDENREDELLDYAARNWAAHFRNADISDDAAIVPLASRICDPASGINAVWCDVYRTSAFFPSMIGLTSLAVASSLGLEAVTRLLLESDDVEINARPSSGETPLWLAVDSGNVFVVKLLLDTSKVDINLCDRDGITPLIWAVCQGDESIVKLLLDAGKVDVNLCGKHGITPLIQAIHQGDESIVKLLLDTGKVDVNFCGKYGTTPLIRAIDQGDESIVKLLLDTGKVDINLCDGDGTSPLIMAVCQGDESIVKLLLDTGKVDISLCDRAGTSPLIWAVSQGDESIVKLLLDTGKVDISLCDENGITPLMAAVNDGQGSIVKLLLATGKVNINASSKGGVTPLMQAVSDGNETIVKMLTEYAAGC